MKDNWSLNLLGAFALIIFAAYVFLNFNSPVEADNIEQAPPRQQLVQPEPVLPVNYSDTNLYTPEIETILPENKANVRVEVHYYYHNKPNVSRNELAPSDLRLVESGTTQGRLLEELIEEKREELDFCQNLSIRGKRFVLIEGLYESLESAQTKVAKLEANRIKGAKIIWLPCYDNSIQEALFAIVLGRPCKTRSSIDDKKQAYLFEVYSAGITYQELGIIILEEKKLNIDLKPRGGEIVEAFTASHLIAIS